MLMLLVASALVFCLPYLAGLDPARAVLTARVGERSLSQTQFAAMQHELGLDRSLLAQYGIWLAGVLRGDWGVSLVSRTPVVLLIGQGLKVTACLALLSVTLALLLSLFLGSLAARFEGRFLDTCITTFSQAGVALPEFWLAPLLILLFALELSWLPSAGWRGPSYYVLPVLTLMMRPLAYFVTLVRSSLLEVLGSDYIRSARAKGLPEFMVLYKHALRNALIPLLTLASSWLAGLLGGSVIVEVIFAVPGMGRLIYEAALASDLPLLQASLLMLIALTLLITTLTDQLYRWINPSMVAPS